MRIYGVEDGTLITPLRLWRRGRWRKGGVLFGKDGIIRRVLSEKEAARMKNVRRLDWKNLLLLPGGVNAHSHAFQIWLRGQSDGAKDFAGWVSTQLYPLALSITEKALYESSLAAFREMLLNGITTVGEFFYLHNAPPPGFRKLGTRYDEIVIQSARDAGIRLVLLRALYDRAKKAGQRRFAEEPAASIAYMRALAKKYASTSLVHVRPAPHSLHGASPEAIRAAAALAEEVDVPFHIHLAEKQSDLAVAKNLYGTTPLRALKRLKVLSERTAAVHGVWLDGEEIRMLADAGGFVVSNPRSNMALGDGIANLQAMAEAGLRVALGCDGPCANNGLDIYSEMRTAEHLQRVHLNRINVIPQAAQKGGRGPDYLFDMGSRFGAEALGIPAGAIEPGRYADFTALDPQDPSMQPNAFGAMKPASVSGDKNTLDAAMANIIFSMVPRAAVKAVIVSGKTLFYNK